MKRRNRRPFKCVILAFLVEFTAVRARFGMRWYTKSTCTHTCMTFCGIYVTANLQKKGEKAIQLETNKSCGTHTHRFQMPPLQPFFFCIPTTSGKMQVVL